MSLCVLLCILFGADKGPHIRTKRTRESHASVWGSENWRENRRACADNL